MLDTPDRRQNAHGSERWRREAMPGNRGCTLTEFQWIPSHLL